MATRSSILAWEVPWTEEPAGLQSMGSQRVRHNFVTEQPYQISENPIAKSTQKINHHSILTVTSTACEKSCTHLQFLNCVSDLSCFLDINFFIENQKLVRTTAIKTDYQPLERRILCHGSFNVLDILCNAWSWLLANSYNVEHELFYTDDYLPEYSNFE